MGRTRLAGQLLYAALPLWALASLPYAPGGAISPALIFIACSLYARMAAVAGKLGGFEESLLFVQLLPFFAYATGFLSGSSAGATLLLSAQAAGLWAALLWIESLLARGSTAFSVALPFLAAACAGGFALVTLPAAATLGLCALALVICANVQARKAIR